MPSQPSVATPDQYSELHNKLDLLISLVEKQQSIPVPIEKALWSTSDIADYLGISYKYTSEWIVTHHSFPCAVRVSTKKGKKGHPRWYAAEVMDWVAEHREAP